MATYSSVACCEEQGTRKESFDGTKATGAVTLICDWTNRYALMADIVGGKLAWPHAGIYAFGASASSTPLDSAGTTDGQSLEYSKARVAVNYVSPGQGDQPDDPVNLVSESLEPTVEFLTLDFKAFFWNADGFPLLEKEAPGRQIRGFNLVRTFYQVEPPIPNEVLTLTGKVNNATVNATILGLAFPAETLLYNPPSLSRTIKSDGSGLAFNITHKFTYRAEGWNRFWRQSTQAYDEIADANTLAIYKNYPLGDFSVLF